MVGGCKTGTMAVSGAMLLLPVLLSLLLLNVEAKQRRDPDFEENFSVMWADDHVQTSGGNAVQLLLDRSSGSAFSTNRKYMFGHIGMDLKLVPGDSAGVVTAYYLASDTEDDRDELDFEFLGNRTGQPYVLQTNVYSSGKGGREQRVLLWFDPSEDYHSYSFLWNQQQIVFYVDKTPVRILTRSNRSSEMYPSSKAMRLISSIWNADGWATRGGLEKTDWSNAPFVASYDNFNVDACDEADFACIKSSNRWWNKPSAWTLSSLEKSQLSWVKSNFVVYDYCTDTRRYPSSPAECSED